MSKAMFEQWTCWWKNNHFSSISSCDEMDLSKTQSWPVFTFAWANRVGRARASCLVFVIFECRTGFCLFLAAKRKDVESAACRQGRRNKKKDGPIVEQRRQTTRNSCFSHWLFYSVMVSTVYLITPSPGLGKEGRDLNTIKTKFRIKCPTVEAAPPLRAT